VVCRVNVKLGGVNVVPDASSVPFLSDPSQPVLVLGADVIHPAPGSDGRPSFTALVGNVDSNVSKYIATSRVQTSRKEIIEDMSEMTKYILEMYNKFRTNIEKKPGYPKRVVLYRYVDLFSGWNHANSFVTATVSLKASSRQSSMRRSRKSSVSLLIQCSHHMCAELSLSRCL